MMSDPKPEDVPEDVWEQAATTYWAVINAEPMTSQSVEIIARAILAERERCAKIAEAEAEFPEPVSGETMTEEDLRVARIACALTKQSIASAIRSNSNGEAK